MFLPTDRAKRAANKFRRARLRWLAGACAAILGASACSERNEILATTARLTDAAPQDSGVCKPSGYPAPDMGLDLFFVLDHSNTSFGGQQWFLLTTWLYSLGLSSPGGPISDAGGSESFEGVGVGFTTYPKKEPPPQSCVDGCAMRTNCDCLRECGCENPLRPPLDPLGPCQCEEWPWSCKEEDYAPTLEIAPLNEGRLIEALGGVGQPDGESTLGPALIASLDYQQAWEFKNPGRRITQVLVMGSDWLGDQCDDVDRISDIENLLKGAERPKTYVVVVDDSLNDDYRTLATAGRTNAPIRLSTQSGPRNPFADLVKKIRDQDQEGRCEYLLPAPSPDLDYDKVNLTAKSDGALFPRVRSPVECVRDGHGWYYDDPAHPKRVVACEEACQTLHTAGAFIQLGCPTVHAPDAGR